MRVLIACERSGIIRDAFLAAGCDAWSCDLEMCEGDGARHIVGDVLKVADPSKFDFFGVHPECRYLGVSGIHWNYRRPERAIETEKALEFAKLCFDLCDRFKHSFLENPVSILSTRIRKPEQIIQPYKFGDDSSKATCLWLKNLPLLTGTEYIKPRMVCKCGKVYTYAEHFKYGCSSCGPGCAKPRWANQTDSGQNKLGPSPTRAMDRARTYGGIARAMAQQWSKL